MENKMGPKTLSRRQFLISSSSLLALLATGCAAMPGKESGAVQYPKLAGEKIQSPEHYGHKGCMTGIYTGNFRSVEMAIENYENTFGQKPSYYILPHHGYSHVSTGFTSSSLNQIKACAAKGVIPFITYYPGDALRSHANLNGIIAGDYDDEIVQAAKDLKSIGEVHGGFFIRTMEHMNAHWLADWGSIKKSKEFKDTWLKIWHIFEAEGTNKYATWVFNPYVPSPYGIAPSFYPGDQYVDWVAMSAFNLDGLFDLTSSSVKHLFNGAYKKMFHKYRNKPIMICEIGMHQRKYKPKWIASAFEAVKTDYFGIKALSWESTQWKKNGTVYLDMRIDSSPESVRAYKKGLSDLYFLGSVPYQHSGK